MPHRKPVPTPGAAPIYQHTEIVPDQDTQNQTQSATNAANTHSRTRTSSSSVLPYMPQKSTTYSPIQQTASPTTYQTTMSTYNPTRRTLSNATTSTSTTGTGGGLVPVRTGSSASITLRRSGSARSGGNPGGYVALLRKQKATVWCDRAQPEDPRHVAARKAAKAKALKNLTGISAISGHPSMSGSGSFPNSSTMSRGFIRHSGRTNTAVGLTPAELVRGVGGQPSRLISSEIGDEDNGDYDYGGFAGHQRNDSGRSSMGSAKKQPAMNLRPLNSGSHRLSHGNSAASATGSSPDDGADETPMPNSKQGYFNEPTHTGISAGSGSSGERENSFGRIGILSQKQTPNVLPRQKSAGGVDDLKRRGSVDDRTMTLGGGRLFIANPDVD